MRRLSLTLVLALVAASATALAADGSEGVVDDETGDVSVQHLVAVQGLPETPSAQEQVELAGDIVQAVVAQETRDSLTFTVTMANLSDNETVPSPLAEVWTHFTVGQTAYHVEAELATPQESDRLQARFQLYEGSTATAEPTGSLDRAGDSFTFTLDKADIGTPQPGEMLTRFYVTSHVPQEGLKPASSPVLDYAPSAQQITVSQETDPTAIDPTHLGLTPAPGYGTPYEFGDYQGIDDLTVQATPTSTTVTAGQSAKVQINVVNQAPKADTVYLTAGNVPSGWTVSAPSDEATLDSGDSYTFTVTIDSPRGARGQHFISLKLTSDLGANQPLSISVSAQAPPQDTGSTQGGSSPAGSGADGGAPTGGSSPAAGDGASTPSHQDDGHEDNASDEEENGAPSPAAGLVVGLMAAIAWTTRRRR